VSTRILVVDDDASTRQVIARVLSREGYSVEDCGSPAEALARLGSATFDVLLTDFVMPGGSGLDLITEATRLHRALRCVIMSGHLRSDETPSSIPWVEKPIDIEKLLSAIGA
jgi:DNA-binding NtrC family response regulator